MVYSLSEFKIKDKGSFSHYLCHKKVEGGLGKSAQNLPSPFSCMPDSRKTGIGSFGWFLTEPTIEQRYDFPESLT